jgi:hypothetical protein
MPFFLVAVTEYLQWKLPDDLDPEAPGRGGDGGDQRLLDHLGRVRQVSSARGGY